MMFAKSRSVPLLGLMVAEFVSQVGNQIAAVTIPILVLQFTHSAIATSLAGVGSMIPIVLSAWVGGRSIDRFGAWRVSVTADLLSGISVLLLPLLFIGLGSASLLLIFLLVFVGALFDPTAISARHILVPKFAKLAHMPLETVNSYRGSLENGADLLGPAAGAALISLIGTVNTFFVNAASFFLCAALFAIAIPRSHPQFVQRERPNSVAGIQFIFQHPQLRSLAIGGMVLNFVLLPFLGLLLPVFITQTLANPALLGICLSLFGLSATLSALSYATLTRWLSHSVIYYGGLLLTAVSILLCAMATTPIALMISVTLGGLMLGAGNPLEQTLFQAATPSRIAGQVFTSQTALSFAAGLLGLLAAGIATELTSVNLVLILSGSFLAIAAVLGGCLLPLVD